MPSLPQCTSGRSWYQRLSNVGFDYGTSFQELSNVRSDGVTHHATASSTIKTDSGLIVGESKYFLHPASIDIPIQLIMVAIYAGKLNDVSCGMTVSTSREISIWIPTAEQLQKGVAKAHAWTTSQGQRVFLANSQLAADDGQLIVDIVDMRCTSYEAAVPANALEVQEQYPYMKMEWKEDIDHFRFPEASADSKVSVKHFVDLLIHKKSTLRILNIDSQIVPDIFEQHPNTSITSISKGDINRQLREDTTIYDLVLSSEVNLNFRSIWTLFDTKQMALDQSSDLKKLSSLLVKGGYLLISETTQSM